MKVNVLGTVFTALSSLPRDLKRHLLLDGATTVFCDVSHAHHCFLPLLLSRRLAHPGANTDGIEAERERLIGFLSDGDYYYSKWRQNSNDPEERTEVKKLANVILNINNKQAPGIALYRRMAKEFPISFRIIEDVKRNDHRNLSKQLQHFASDAINGALMELQGKNFSAIPDTDAILCRAKDKERVCEVIGKHLFRVSGGVCCKVGGVRYAPEPKQIKKPFEHSRKEWTPAEQKEIRRIADELKKLYDAGRLPDSQKDLFLVAKTIHLFDASAVP